IYLRHFSDIELITPIRISFGRRSYRRLGSIIIKPRLVEGQRQPWSIITISSLLQEPEVPGYVIDQIIAHELVHYVHGFGSERPRQRRHPHQGGVIVREFKSRGLCELFRVYQAWMKLSWPAFVRNKSG